MKKLLVILILVGAWVFYYTRPVEDLGKLKEPIVEALIEDNEDLRFRSVLELKDTAPISENEIWLRSRTVSDLDATLSEISESINKVLTEKGFKKVTEAEAKAWKLDFFKYTAKNKENKKLLMANDKILGLYDITVNNQTGGGSIIKIKFHSKKISEIGK